MNFKDELEFRLKHIFEPKVNWEHVYTVLLAQFKGDEMQAREALLFLMKIEDDIESEAS